MELLQTVAALSLCSISPYLCCSRSEEGGGGGGGLELQLNAACRQTQRCWSESQRERCSPTGRAVTTPDTSETCVKHTCMFFQCCIK